MSVKPLKIVIDGKPVEARRGVTILQAAREAGIHIPSLCDHKDLSPFGACRLCLVKIKGQRDLKTACTTPVTEGMVVRTRTRAIRELRRNILELILSEHPYTCLVCKEREQCPEYTSTTRKVGVTTGCQFCPAVGDCRLQELVEELGLESVRFPVNYRGREVEQDDPFFDRDYNLCILCGRCVRVCQELRSLGTLAFVDRGDRTLVGTAYGRSHLDLNCGFCGACVDVCPTGALSEKGVKWEPRADRVKTSICPLCSTGCTLDYHVRDDTILRTTPNPKGRVNRGQACVRGRFGVRDALESPKRLLHPWVRKGRELSKVSWDEALRAAADGFRRHRGRAAALIASPDTTNEDAYVLEKFARTVLKTPYLDLSGSPGRIGLASVLAEMTRSNARSASLRDIEGADAILALGTGFLESHPVVGMHVRRAVRRGSDLITVGPGGLSELTTHAIACRPGEETKVLRRLGAYMRARGLRGRGEVREVALALGTRARVVVLLGEGALLHNKGSELVDLLNDLPLRKSPSLLPVLGSSNLFGAIRMGLVPDLLPGFRPSPRKEHGLSEILRDIGTGKIRALYLVGELPPLPELRRLDHLLVQAPYGTETAELAHVVLPAAPLPEVRGTVVNLESRVQALRSIRRPKGESRADGWIVSRLAELLGAEGFAYRDPVEIRREFELLLGRKGKPVRVARGRGRPRTTSPRFPFLLLPETSLFSLRGMSLLETTSDMKRVTRQDVLLMNPEDARKRGIGEGDRALVTSESGSGAIRVSLKEDVASGILRLPSSGLVELSFFEHGVPESGAIPVDVRRAR